LPTLIMQQPIPSTMPSHLQAMSQVFARFSAENTRPLQSQLDSTRKTLAVTREGAMDLQRKALKLQDDLQDAQTEAEEAKTRHEQAEAKLERQKYEFERREESFERVKEHYKAETNRKELELANVKEQYGRELNEAKAELARLKHKHTEKIVTTEVRKRKDSDYENDKHQNKDQRSEHYRRHSMGSNPNADLHENATPNNEISPSIPRKIEYDAVDRLCEDAEESRKRIKVSGRSSRHSTGNVTTRKRHPSAPYELQPPRKPRASSEPKVRGKTEKKEQHRTDTRNVKQVNAYAKQRNPLESVSENSAVDNVSGVNFCEKKEPRNKRERSSKKYHQSHAGGIEGEGGIKTSNFASSSSKQKATNNPYLKQLKPEKKLANEDEPSFAFQEVVRGRDKRQALPGHDCEECRQFFDALGKGYDTGKMVMECSRHRARYIPPSTPPGFWNLTFVDSVSSQKSTD